MDELNRVRIAQETAEKNRELLSHEMAHRLKNVLATVQAVAQQTFKQDRASGELKMFAGRLQSIAAAQNLLLADDIGHIDLAGVIKSAVTPFDDGSGRIRLTGPQIKVEFRANVAIALTFHELCTNAVKYGALRGTEGTIDIKWSLVAGGLGSCGKKRTDRRWFPLPTRDLAVK